MRELRSGRHRRLPARPGRLALAIGTCLCAGQLLTSTPALGAGADPVTATAALSSATASTLAVSTVAVAPARSVVYMSVSSSTPAYGQAVALTGRVVTAAGAPVAGRTAYLQAWTRAGWKTHAGQRTSATGYVQWRVPQYALRAYRVFFPAQVTGGRTLFTQGISGLVRITPRPRVVAVAPGARVVAEAAKLSGRPYRYGAAGPSAFDCSGYTQYVFRKFGRSLPHSANGQQAYGRAVSTSQARPGDLIFFRNGSHAYHVGIYAGGGYMYDAPSAGGYTGRHRIWGSYVARRVIG